ncbi:MAG: LuxR C-terminal-related transcriptional regulator [Planctomycetota bacterium]
MPYNWDRGRIAFLAGEGGVIVINLRDRESEGRCFLEWCADDVTRERLIACYAECFTFRKEQLGIEALANLKDHDEPVKLLVNFRPWREREVQVEAFRDFRGLLSEREEELLTWIGNDISDDTIAEAMGITIRTVQGMRSDIKKKLGVTQTAGLILAADRLGWGFRREQLEGCD